MLRRGTRPVWLGTRTVTARDRSDSANRQVIEAPGTASGSSSAQASSTAMRRSSISSRVKSSRAASPAVAVRSTER